MRKRKNNYSKKNLNKIKSYSTLVIFLILLLFFFDIFDFKTNFIILLFSLIIIIILYYNQKIRMIEYKMKTKAPLCKKKSKEDFIENFEFNVIENEKLDSENNVSCKQTNGARINYHCASKDYKSPVNPINSSVINNLYSDLKNNVPTYLNENVLQSNKKKYNPNFLTKTDNNKLIGSPNPKTLVPPIIAPRTVDLQYWSMTNNFRPEIINSEKGRYEDESGYRVKEQILSNEMPPENYLRPRKVLKKGDTKYPNYTFRKMGDNKYKTMENFSDDTIHQNTRNKSSPISEEHFQKDGRYSKMNEDEYQLFNKDFRTNPYFKDKYNPNVFTSTVTPGTYHINDRNEPINSLMGVSYEQQFEPSNYDIIEPFETVNMSNTYDPRFNGYGTSYRSYIDENVGQPRFYYDDVNAIKMPNYISRNAIDVTTFGDSYGPLNSGNEYTQNIHRLADEDFTDSTINFRTEMMDRLMRKRNSESWQQRTFPIRTGGQRMLK
jgi:hypothetical protein